MTSQPLRYADAGVSFDAWNITKKNIGKLVRQTYTPQVLGCFGQFGGLFDISEIKKYDRPVLVSSVDGVGTKLKIAFSANVHDTVGEDIVNHCINDILVMGAQPLFFLDYIGTGKLEPEVATKVVEGLARACCAAGIALIGGETAEMPGFYADGEYDIAGTIIGIAEAAKIVDGREVKAGDVAIGLRSNGLHTNGYSLARKIVVEIAGHSYGDVFAATGRTFGQELLRPHRSYLPVLPLLRSGDIKACAHITGGGFPDNVDRVLPPDCDIVIDTCAWQPDPIFCYLRQTGGVELPEMYRTFNMGIGLVLIARPHHMQRLLASKELAPFDPIRIGTIVPGTGKVQLEY